MPLNKKLIAGACVFALAAAATLLVRAAASFVTHQQPIGYVAQPVVSNSNVSTGTAKMYSIDYVARDWSGNVYSYPLTKSGTIVEEDDWGGGGASAKIKEQSKNNNRYIVTIEDPAIANRKGIPFQWDQLSQGAGGQRAALDPNAGTTATSSLVLDYIRGSSANEGALPGQFRKRNYGLGDIIHSSPVYWNDGANQTVFVGSNDGMLHAINAVDGSERFAYVPAVLLPDLSKLTDLNYSHRYYVDGRMDVKKVGSKTILVGTLGAGGKAIFALDVTNANATSEADAAAKVMWEVTNQTSGYADLGDTYGAPSLVTLPDGTHALAVGNGYNNTGSGHAVLYLVNPNTGAVIKALGTGSGSTSSPNGLSSPSLWDTDGDGRKDIAYAGDIDGNLWKFMLSSPYTVTKLHTNSLGASHAITMAPGLMAHPLGGVMVQFVTGRMLTPADSTDTSSHYAYGIWDGAPAANDQLFEHTLIERNYVAGNTTTRVRLADVPSPPARQAPDWRAGRGNDRGWKTKLPIGGERVVGDGAFVTGAVFQFFSTNPAINRTGTPPGENWWMQLNGLTGGAVGTTVFDLNDDRQFTSDDQVDGRDPVGRDMGGGVRSQLIGLSASGGVDVYQSSFDRNGAPAVGTVTVTTKVVDGDRGVSGGHFDTDFICYKNCGAATSTYRTINSPNGVYSVGRESGGATDTLNYVHVHEYDDIYDRTGINMLKPSQDMQRLALAKSTTSVTHSPNTPQLRNDNALPTCTNCVTLVSTKVDTGKTANNVPAPDYRYVDGPAVQEPGYPVTTSTSKTNRTRYTTTLTVAEAINIGARKDKKYPYDLKTTVRSWETVVDTVESFPNIRFKVLMSNQAYSPAVNFTIDGAADVPQLPNASFTDSAFKFQAATGLNVATLPSYNLGGITNLMFSMPLDAFNVRDWGTDIVRTGLHPIRPQCAGIAVNEPTLGPNKEWRNGALTLQIVDAGVQASEVQLNVAGQPKLGYRLTNAALKTRLIAEYLIYWHHPNNKCMADSGWTMKPPQDTSPSDALDGKHAAGSQDPAGGRFIPGTGQASNTVPPAPVIPPVDNGDGTITYTEVVHTALEGGGYIVTTTTRTEAADGGTGSGVTTGGAVGGRGCTGADCDADKKGELTNGANLGRINWRELQR